ncbi:hypothetical protein ACS0TY_021507 [Phlomoides rotata]
MIVGERGSSVHVPPWSADDPIYLSLSPNATGAVDDCSLFLNDSLQRYLPSNTSDAVPEFQFSDSVDAQSCDHFRMFDFKVRRCSRGRSHDWTECPFAHPGEKARRRDPRKFHYSGTACPDFRKGNCRKGDACEFAHGVFECWLHPARYRTQPCKDGINCKRRVCFFAHSPDQLRVLSPRSESRRLAFLSLLESVSPPIESPPMSPMMPNPLNETMAALRQLHLSKSPRPEMILPGYFSTPTTPTRAVARGGIEFFVAQGEEEEEEILGRVESGRGKENPLDSSDPEPGPNLDVGWISELIK